MSSCEKIGRCDRGSTSVINGRYATRVVGFPVKRVFLRMVSTTFAFPMRGASSMRASPCIPLSGKDTDAAAADRQDSFKLMAKRTARVQQTQVHGVSPSCSTPAAPLEGRSGCSRTLRIMIARTNCRQRSCRADALVYASNTFNIC